MSKIYFKKMQVEIVSENNTHIKYRVVGKPAIHTMDKVGFFKLYKEDAEGAAPITDLAAVKASIAPVDATVTPAAVVEPVEEPVEDEKFDEPTGTETVTEEAAKEPTAAEKRKATRAAAKAKKSK